MLLTLSNLAYLILYKLSCSVSVLLYGVVGKMTIFCLLKLFFMSGKGATWMSV